MCIHIWETKETTGDVGTAAKVTHARCIKCKAKRTWHFPTRKTVIDRRKRENVD